MRRACLYSSTDIGYSLTALDRHFVWTFVMLSRPDEKALKLDFPSRNRFARRMNELDYMRYKEAPLG